MLHLPDDPQAVAVINSIDMLELNRELPRGNHDTLRIVLEALAARGIVPDEWTHDERVSSLAQDWRVPELVLRNPLALLTAERLLLDALDVTYAESVRAHGEYAARGRYVGVRSWEALCAQSWAGDRGVYLPSAQLPGFARCHSREYEIARPWLEATRDTGTSYGSVGEHVWWMADQLASGCPWVTSLYKTGLGLWCWRDEWGAPEWALIVRPGDGTPWPVFLFHINTEKTW